LFEGIRAFRNLPTANSILRILARGSPLDFAEPRAVRVVRRGGTTSRRGIELTDGHVISRTPFIRPPNMPHDERLLAGLLCKSMRLASSLPATPARPAYGVWAAGKCGRSARAGDHGGTRGSAAAIAFNVRFYVTEPPCSGSPTGRVHVVESTDCRAKRVAPAQRGALNHRLLT
jgi:hypothetical protein